MTILHDLAKTCQNILLNDNVQNLALSISHTNTHSGLPLKFLVVLLKVELYKFPWKNEPNAFQMVFSFSKYFSKQPFLPDFVSFN